MVIQHFFKKKAQKRFPLQVPYHIKVSLQEYYNNFANWEIPDFSDKCLICKGTGCARYHGYYTRRATCPESGFSVSDLPIIRIKCYGKGDDRICDHITFSLLPLELVPFRQLSLKFMVMAIWIKVNRKLSLTSALDAIEQELNHLGDVADFINISTMASWQQMILTAFTLFLSGDIKMVSGEQVTSLQDGDIGLFLNILIHHKTRNVQYPIRGPDGFAWDFYQQSGGSDQCAPFLFGLASQHR